MFATHPIVRKDLETVALQPAGWSRLQGRTVLVTGAGGLIASHLIAALAYLNDTAALGVRVVCLARSGERARKRLGGLMDRPDVAFVEQDVRHPIETGVPVDYILHTASAVRPDQFVREPAQTIETNVYGTAQVLKFAARQACAGVLYLSTREIYGASDQAFVAEDDYGPLDPTLTRSSYSESKRMAETLCAAYRSEYHVPVKIARIAHTYGPGMALGDGRVAGDLIDAVRRGRDIVLNSAGETEICLTYISDVIAGLYLHLLGDTPFVCNLSDDARKLTVKELGHLLAGLYPERGLRVRHCIQDTEKLGYQRHRTGLLDSGLLRGFGWKPRTPLEDGLKKTVAYAESEEA